MTENRMRWIRELRERTGAGIGLIQEALDATDNDLGKAEAYIAAHPRAGLIWAETHQGRIGALVEVRCDTDFVARTEEFRALCRELALQVIGGPTEVPLMEQPHIRDAARTVADLVAACARNVGETITVRRYVRYEL
jgi:elongation factor Ts